MNEIIQKIILAMNEFKQNDYQDLISVRNNEMCFSHRIAFYLEQYFEGYHIDCEYSKKGNAPKMCEDKVIRPDIIIHKRKFQDSNNVIFEIKLSGKDSQKGRADIEKLKSEIICLQYKYGVFIGILKRKIEIVFIDSYGNEIERNIENN